MSEFLPIVPGSLPPGYCWPDPQTYNRDILTIATVLLPDTFGKIWSSDVEPPVDKRDYIWFYTPNQKLYFYVNGVWQRVFDIPVTSKKLYPFFGSLSDITTEDGGDNLPAGVYSGPLWTIHSDWNGRTFVGVGDVPNSDPALTLAQGDTGGSGDIALDDLKYIPYHGHGLPAAPVPIVLPTFSLSGSDFRSPSDNRTDGSVGFRYEGGDPNNGNATVPHDNMQPYKAGYWLRRSGRIYVQPPN